MILFQFLQIVAAFGTYIVADELLSVSGLLAVVSLGTWLAAKGNHRISSRVNKPMREVWCVLRALRKGRIQIHGAAVRWPLEPNFCRRALSTVQV